MSGPILATRALTRAFGELTAVDHVDFEVKRGELFGLVGPNGAGKTTTIKMLTTILKPTSGTAEIAGFDIVKQAAEVRNVIGYVPQLLSADGALTGYENLLFFAKLYGIPKKEREERIRNALEAMGLWDARNRLVRTYSGGMIRRLEIAQVVMHEPALLFLDEPTVGLDPVARDAVWEQMKRLAREGMTCLFTTHYMEEADTLCDTVAVMHRGRVVANGPPAILKKSIGNENATLDDVFRHYSGGEIDTGGSYRDTRMSREAARRHS